MTRPRSTSILRSGYEDRIKAVLDAECVQYGYETEAFPYVTSHKYIPDFVFYHTKILVEAKGYFTPKDRSKLLKVRPAIEEEGWELRLVFQRANNLLNKTSATTYADWADRHGFVWAEGQIPKEWYT